MTEDIQVGEILAGKYRVEKMLGKGGMGVVVGARHIKLDEPVAIKLLRPAMLEVEGMVSRFLREARAASKIKSLHVVRVTDVDTLEDGVPYMVMEHLEGIDFSELRKQKGTLGVALAVGYLLEATEAIGEAHTLGIVHRDLKPGNLFLHQTGDGRTVVKVLDFGISKREAPGEEDTTKTGQMMGSPKYMAPEQMLSMHDVDGRSDIWSLGAVLYELLTGRPPFIGDTTPRICAQVLNADPPPPSTLRPDLPVELERAILRCLEKEPDRRFATVADFAEAIAPFGPPPEPKRTRSGAFKLSLPTSIKTGENPKPITISSISAAPAPAEAPKPVAASVTPTPATWDADTRLDPSPRKESPRGGRIAAAVVGLAIVGGLGALYLTQRGPAVVAAAAPPTSLAPTDAVPAATATPTGEPQKAPPATEPAKTAYSLSDLPDVRPPRPLSSAGGPFAKPKPTASDPFGGRRN